MSIFQFLSVCGTIAARQDWSNFVFGAGEKTPFEFLKVGVENIEVRNPMNCRAFLEYDDDWGEVSIIARDVQMGFEMPVSVYARRVFTLDLKKFGKWLAHKLLKGREASVAVVDDRCVKIVENPVEVFFLLPGSPAMMLRTFRTLEIGGKPVLVLLCEPSDMQASKLQDILKDYPDVRLEAAGAFVSYITRSKDYEYSHAVPFVDYLQSLTEAPPPGTFLKRPAGMGWKDLELILKVQDKDGPVVYDDDVLIARYRDAGGKTVDGIKAFVKDIPRLCGQKRKAVRTSRGIAFLKALARGKSAGMSTSSDSNSQKALSVLRQTLCGMFGYFASDDPIPNRARKATLLRAMFSIRFSDGESDPILRDKALVDISQRQDL